MPHQQQTDQVPASSREAADPKDERHATMLRLEARSFANTLEARAMQFHHRSEVAGELHKAAQWIRRLLNDDPKPAERGEARPPDQLVGEIQVQSGALDAVLSVYERHGTDRFTANVANLRYIHSLLSRAVSALAAPAAQPETTPADLASLKAAINANAFAAVVRHDELRVALAQIAKLSTELVALKAERAASAAQPKTVYSAEDRLTAMALARIEDLKRLQAALLALADAKRGYAALARQQEAQAAPAAGEAPRTPEMELVEAFIEWWHAHRDGSVNAAYQRVDQFVKDVEEQWALTDAGRRAPAQEPEQ